MEKMQKVIDEADAIQYSNFNSNFVIKCIGQILDFFCDSFCSDDDIIVRLDAEFSDFLNADENIICRDLFFLHLITGNRFVVIQ